MGISRVRSQGGSWSEGAKRPALRREEMDSEQPGRQHAEPAATIEQPGQRDHQQPGGLEHETLLGPVGDQDPVRRHVRRRQSRERPDVGVQQRPGATQAPGPAQARRPRTGTRRGSKTASRMSPSARQSPMGEVVRAQPHRIRAVPSRQPDAPERFQMERIQGIAGQPDILPVPGPDHDQGQQPEEHPGARAPAAARSRRSQTASAAAPSSKPPKTIPVGFVPSTPPIARAPRDKLTTWARHPGRNAGRKTPPTR